MPHSSLEPSLRSLPCIEELAREDLLCVYVCVCVCVCVCVYCVHACALIKKKTHVFLIPVLHSSSP